MKFIKKIFGSVILLSLLSSCADAAAQNADTWKETAAETASTIAGQVTEAGKEKAKELAEGAIDKGKEKAQEIINDTTDKAKESIDKIGSIEEVSLVYVVDGDTLTVVGSDGLEYKVRLIGIDTPESVHSDESKNNEYGVMASNHTKEMLADVNTLYLEYDVQVTDKYNRTLAYVWFAEDTSDINNMLNARILKDGYAVDKVYLPNQKYAKQFKQICKEANQSNAGLWADEGYRNLVGR